MSTTSLVWNCLIYLKIALVKKIIKQTFAVQNRYLKRPVKKINNLFSSLFDINSYNFFPFFRSVNKIIFNRFIWVIKFLYFPKLLKIMFLSLQHMLSLDDDVIF